MRNNIQRIIDRQNHGYNIESHMISNGGFTTLANARKVYNLSTTGRCKETSTAAKRWLNQIAIPVGYVNVDNSNRKTMLYMHRDLNDKFGNVNNLFSMLSGLNRMFNYNLINNNTIENRRFFNKKR